jgi:hypothetical protein
VTVAQHSTNNSIIMNTNLFPTVKASAGRYGKILAWLQGSTADGRGRWPVAGPNGQIRGLPKVRFAAEEIITHVA